MTSSRPFGYFFVLVSLAPFSGQFAFADPISFSAVLLHNSQFSVTAPKADGNVFTCENPYTEQHRPFGTVFDQVDLFPAESGALISVKTYFNSDGEASRKERVHLAHLGSMEDSYGFFKARSSDGLYAVSIRCTSRCDYAGSRWQGTVTYATTWDDQQAQGVRTDDLICKRVGWFR